MFIILGAGASVDSGLPTFRGNHGFYKNETEVEQALNIRSLRNPVKLLKIWKFLQPLYGDIHLNKTKLGETYDILKRITSKQTLEPIILNQNIDLYPEECKLSSSTNIINIHGTHDKSECIAKKCKAVVDTPKCIYDKNHLVTLEDIKCPVCKMYYLRPKIILFGEDLDLEKLDKLFEMFQEHRPKYTLVIGTSIRFPYIEMFIRQARFFGSKIVHVNPDPKYNEFVIQGDIWLKDIKELKNHLQ